MMNENKPDTGEKTAPADEQTAQSTPTEPAASEPPADSIAEPQQPQNQTPLTIAAVPQKFGQAVTPPPNGSTNHSSRPSDSATPAVPLKPRPTGVSAVPGIVWVAVIGLVFIGVGFVLVIQARQAHEAEQLRQQIVKADEEAADAQRKLTEWLRRHRGTEEAQKRVEGDLRTLEHELEQKSTRLGTLESEQKDLKEKTDSAKAELDATRADLDAAKQRDGELQAKQAELEAAQEKDQAAIEQNRNAIQTNKRRIEEHSQKLDSLDRQFTDLNNKFSEWQKRNGDEMDRLRRELDEHRDRMDKLQAADEFLRDELKRQNGELKDLEATVDRLRKDSEESKRRTDELRRELDRAERENQRRDQSMQDQLNRLEGEKQELERKLKKIYDLLQMNFDDDSDR